MDTLFKTARELASHSTWSAGVELARNADFQERRGVLGDERTFSLHQGPRDRILTVVLSEANELWQCDCGANEDPCKHVVATILAVRQGLPGRPLMRASSTAPGVVVHTLSRRDGRISFARALCAGEVRVPFITSLTQAITARASSLPPIAYTNEELLVDHILTGRKDGVLDPKTMRLIIPMLARVSNVELDGEPIRVLLEAIAPSVIVLDEPGGFRVRRDLTTGVSELFENGVALLDGALCAVEDSALSLDELKLISGEGTFFPAAMASELASRIIPHLESKVTVDVQTKELPRARRIAPRIVIETVSDPDGARMSVIPHLVYGDPVIAQVRAGALELLSRREVPVRDPVEESRLERDLRSRLALRLNEALVLNGEGAVRFVERLRGWETRGDGVTIFNPASTLEPTFSEGSDSLDMILRSSTGATISLKSALAAHYAGGSFVQLTGGGWGALPKEWLASHLVALERMLAFRASEQRSPAALLPEVSEICDSLGLATPDYFERLRKGLEHVDSLPEAILPGDLTAELRPYQVDGVRWLLFLRSHGLNGLLADDMGLGKTLQALCVAEGRTLVVAPTSVLHSWREQIARFRPTLTVSLYHGPQRVLDCAAAITITSYALMRLDIEQLQVEEWDTIILDEAQMIRNPDSQVARASYKLRGAFKISLSGTPIENSLLDLWSQFHFLAPGLLGPVSDFRRHSTSSTTMSAAARLKRRTTPFILRRLKRDVAKELPPKTEVVLECELSKEERTVYESVMAATRSEIVERIGGGEGIFSALEAILRLRQACCHTALLPGIAAESSSKIELLLESLGNSLEQGHRALVFSQWTSLLDLIEPKLSEQGISFSRIDGSTSDRGAIVEQFQRSDGPAVMLLSLKAGGLGLTLTAADHVYILDPWWNPATEDQAADRSYRIGQENPVMVHRLVASDTIEGRILALQGRKRALLSEAIGDSSGISLSRQDILEILS